MATTTRATLTSDQAKQILNYADQWAAAARGVGRAHDPEWESDPVWEQMREREARARLERLVRELTGA